MLPEPSMRQKRYCWQPDAMTGTQGFSRIKVGVGEKPQGWDLADHVLGRFSSEDRAKVEEAIGHAMDAAVLMMQGETDKAMNIYN